MSSSIKTNNPVQVKTPSITYDVNTFNLVNAPVLNNANTNLISRNIVTGNLEIVDSTSFPSAVNIYNSNGSLIGNRTLTLGGFNLTISGIGAVTIASSAILTLDSSLNVINMGTSTATAVNIGRSGINNTLGGNLFASHLTLDNTKTQFLSYDTVTKRVFYGDISSLPSATNIYNADGTISSVARTVNINPNSSLTFTDIGLTGTRLLIDTTAGGTIRMDANTRVYIATLPSSTSIEMGNASCLSTTITSQNTLIQGGTLSYLTPSLETAPSHLLTWTNTGLIRRIVAADTPNLYTTDGTITSSNRVVTVPASRNLNFNGTNTSDFGINTFRNVTASCSNNLTLSGDNNVFIQSTNNGNIVIGQNPTTALIVIGGGVATDVNIGCTGSLTLNGATDIKMSSLVTDTVSDYLLYFNNATKVVTKAIITNDYGTIRFSNQVSQTITSTTPQLITAGTATGLTFTSNLSLSASRSILYSGVARIFRISFTGNVSAASSSQAIGVSIFINGVEMSDTNNSTQLQATGSSTLNTCEMFLNLSPGDLVSIGFSRSSVDTTVTFTGNLSLQTVRLNNIA